MNVLLFLPDAELGLACRSDKTIAHICNSCEFWRKRLSIILDYNFKTTDKYHYKEIYQNLRAGGLGKTPDALLALAAKYGYLDIVKILVAGGANIVAFDDELKRISKDNDESDYLDYLREHDDETTSVALMMAVMYGHLEIVDYIMQELKYPHFALDYSLELAGKYGQLGIVIYLMKSGASFTAMEYALYRAAEYDHLEIIKYIVEHTPPILHAILSEALFRASERGNLNVAKYLIGMIGPALIAEEMKLAADSAIKNNHLQIVEYLIGLNIVDDAISLAFTSAAFHGNLSILKYTIEKGADIHTNNDVAVRVAAHNGHLHILRYLIDTVGMIADYDSALNVAANQGQLDVINYLVRKGANIDSIPTKMRKQLGI
jgi:ankyrin repeat protein